jgi:hypothetical protein
MVCTLWAVVAHVKEIDYPFSGFYQFGKVGGFDSNVIVEREVYLAGPSTWLVLPASPCAARPPPAVSGLARRGPDEVGADASGGPA